ncbi:uncharacterized protein LOC127278282 isoform X2 [Leptopilina boulardi]|uniref:uncharacterized protein LOC127278282 isoform X2 n=1 Tax=Leptopilina boulardi TaxID=63433 RepID=UPI0021F5ED39|nr:uncharacterized protein LOC127278282 isoform X2 [Leptopilina boulardi]
MLGVRKLLRLLIYMVIGLKNVSSNSDIWPLERPDGMPAIQSLEVMCGKDHMDVHLSFSQPFEGIVSSKGQHADPRCVYVPPSTGQTFFSFRIAYARCGTKPDMHGQFYENTVVVQYDKDLLEVWDEAKRLRCEWFNDYEKTASKPPMVIADLDVIQLDFRGDNVDCWMEIQHGKGPWAPPVSGIVPLGSTLTLVVAINDYRGEFDMRVKSCVASDGGGHTIQLSDEFGCVLRPKMISRFLKARGSDDRATVITYAFFHAFKFPDALSVHIKCKVEICRHGCLDHCQLSDSADRIQERKDVNVRPLYSQTTTTATSASHEEDGLMYDDIIQNNNNNDAMTSVGGQFLGVEKSAPKAQAQMMSNRVSMSDGSETNSGTTSMDPQHLPPILEPARVTRYDGEERFPHGPRNLDEEEDTPQDDDDADAEKNSKENSSEKKIINPESRRGERIIHHHHHNHHHQQQSTENPIRRKRSVIVSDRKVRSADVGVSGIYEVISEADLAFSPDTHAEAVTVFQGRIREEVVYGICLPVPGFSALFVIVALSAVISALVAGAMLHRLQVQREMMRENQKNHHHLHHHHHQQQQQQQQNETSNGWLSYGLLRVRCSDRLQSQKPGANPVEQG